MTALRCALCWLTKSRPELAVLVVKGNSSCESCWPYLYNATMIEQAVSNWQRDHPYSDNPRRST